VPPISDQWPVARAQGGTLTAITNGGVIPDQFDYDVLLIPEGVRIGTLNEDFAFESLAGDIFQQLPHPADTVGPGAGGRRKRPAAQHPLLVRRGAGAR